MVEPVTTVLVTAAIITGLASLAGTLFGSLNKDAKGKNGGGQTAPIPVKMGSTNNTNTNTNTNDQKLVNSNEAESKSTSDNENDIQHHHSTDIRNKVQSDKLGSSSIIIIGCLTLFAIVSIIVLLVYKRSSDRNVRRADYSSTSTKSTIKDGSFKTHKKSRSSKKTKK